MVFKHYLAKDTLGLMGVLKHPPKYAPAEKEYKLLTIRYSTSFTDSTVYTVKMECNFNTVFVEIV